MKTKYYSGNDFFDRCISMGQYIVQNKATVRSTARHFGMSKSSVHRCVTKILSKIDPGLWHQVEEVLAVNKKERNVRGGEATRKKFLKNK